MQGETQKALRRLGIGGIPTEWVERVWDNNFCESVGLPTDNHTQLLDEESWAKLVAVCRKWQRRRISTENSPEDSNVQDEGIGFWTTLLEAEVSHRSLMVVIYGVLERDKLEPVDRLCAVYASQLYLTLLQLPGSGAFKIFHLVIFQKSLDVFNLFADQGRTMNRPLLSGMASKHGKRKRQQLEEQEPGVGAVVQGGEKEVNALLKGLVKDVYAFLQEHSLSSYEATRYHIAQVLLKICRAELYPKPLLTDKVLSSVDLSGRNPICLYAWRCLEVLCQSKHGPIETVISEVFHQVLPCLLLLTAEGGVSTSNPLPSHITSVSHDALTFVCYVSSLYGESISVPLRTLVQHLCTKAPDRTEYRSKVAAVVAKLLSLFPNKPYSQLLEWIYKLSRNTKVVYRVLVLDVVSELLGVPLRQSKDGELEEEEEYRLGYQFLMRIVLSRCSDKAPSVCGHALYCLMSAATSNHSNVVDAVRASVQSRSAIDPLVADPFSSSESVVIQMVRRRTTHGKVSVRKSAVQALEALVKLDKHNTKKEDIVSIYERCLDPALSVRKQALTSLTSLMVERQECTMIHSYWLDGVLPMVMDQEAGAKERCLQVLDEVILSNITDLNKSTTESHQFVWQLLSLIASADRPDLKRYLCRVFDSWSRNGKLTASLVRDICTHTAGSKEHGKAAWMLLAKVSEFSSAIEFGFVIDQWKCHHMFVSMETDSPLVHLLTVIGNLATHLGKIAIQDIKDDILSMLSEFKLCPAVIQSALHTLYLIATALSSQSQHQTTLNDWCTPLLQRCESYLSKLVGVKAKKDSSTISREERKGKINWNEESEMEAVKYIFTLGELSQLCPCHTSHHMGLMVQSILLATSEYPQSDHSKRIDPVSSIHLPGLTDLDFSPVLRGHTYITLGKMCLHNEDLATQSVVQMARELEISKHQTVRNNIVIVLCDLTVRYSAMVDPYIATISSCLRDESLVVRKQTLTLLACLLQEDYVKWKGSLFFHFVSSLVDPELKRFCEFCMVHLLLTRHPAMFYQHLVECVFHFNGYERHKVYNRFPQTNREKELFCLKGAKNSSKRMEIYTFLISHMADEHRFQLTARLCQEILGGIVDGTISLDDESVGVVKDTLVILSSKEIKLSSMKRNMGEELAEEGDQVGAAVATAQAKIISQIVKNNVIENIVPIVIAVKHLFEQQHSPYVKDVLIYLKELMQDYRNEISDILSCDKQLADEIEFDLKRLDEEQKMSKIVPTTAVITPHAQMISPLLPARVMGSPVTMVTVTPPKLRTPARDSPWKSKTTPTLTAALKTPFRVQMAVSPLVVSQKLRTTSKTPLSTQLHPQTPNSRPHPLTRKTTRQDVSSPVAARARVNLVNTSFSTRVNTPAIVIDRQPDIPLQRAVLLSTAHKRQTAPRQLSIAATPGIDPDRTLLPGRAASTPEGLCQSVSFNVSALIPPSPIPPNTTLTCYEMVTRNHALKADNKLSRTTRGSKVEQGRVAVVDSDGRSNKRAKQSGSVKGVPANKNADILMISPDNGPKRLDKWRVKLK